jgi:hypothetical protein
MLGHGARYRRFLPTESIPRDGLRDVRRQLECTHRAKALSARVLAKSHVPQRARNPDDRSSLKNDRLDPDPARGDADATELKRLRNGLRMLAGDIATVVEC